jgi:hypothetical protein
MLKDNFAEGDSDESGADDKEVDGGFKDIL